MFFSIPGQAMYQSIWKISWDDLNELSLTTVYVLGGGVIAFSMEIFEFLVVTYTSSLTLSIIGILKVV